MEHLRLLLPLVLSATRARSEGSGAGEWQEDSGVGLYRDPNEGAGPMTSVQSVDLEKKVSLSRFDVACNHSVHLVKWESNHLLLLLFFFLSPTGERFRKHRVRPEPRGGAQFCYNGSIRTPTPLRPRED